MRNMNITLILDVLRRYAPLSRTRLANMVGLNKATVSSIVRELIDKGLVVELGTRETKAEVGHPSIDLSINSEAGNIIGAEIGVDYVSVLLTNLSSEVLWRRYQKMTGRTNVDGVLGLTQRLLAEAYLEAGKSDVPLLGLGLAVPGLVDISSGTLLFAPYLGWTDVPLRRLIESQMDIPVYIGNEAHMAALGESYFGAARDSDYVLYVSAGFGLSGGIILNGNVLPGAAGLAGEIGHMMVDPGGKRCNCGNLGCWETLASQQALHTRIQEAIASGQISSLAQTTRGNLEGLSLPGILEAARSHDQVALQSLQETGYWLGIGIANLINLLNPQLLVLGGTLSLAHEFILPIIHQVVADRALRWPCKTCDIKLASYKEDAGVMGAVATVYWEILNHPQDWLYKVRRSPMV